MKGHPAAVSVRGGPSPLRRAMEKEADPVVGPASCFESLLQLLQDLFASRDGARFGRDFQASRE